MYARISIKMFNEIKIFSVNNPTPIFIALLLLLLLLQILILCLFNNILNLTSEKGSDK